jgi:PAS domain S-box-containing protein
MRAEHLAAATLLADHAALAIANSTALRAVHDPAALAGAELFASPIIGVVVSDLDARLGAVNDAVLAIIGYSRQEVMDPGFVWRDLTPAEWREVDARAIDQLTASGIGDLREKEMFHKLGHRVPVLIGSKMLSGSSQCISFILDLSARKQAEAALERLRREHSADQRFRGLLEAAPDAMVVVDPTGTIVLVNGQVETLFGYQRTEVLGQPIEMLIPEAARADHRAHVAGYVRAPQPRRMGSGLDLFGRRKDGSEFPIEVGLSPVETGEGMLVSSAIRDVSERRLAEAQRAQLATIVEASADAIVGKDLEGMVTSWNPGAERLFGYAAAEIVGRSIMMIVPPELIGEEAAILDALRHGEVRQFETERRRKDGRVIDVSVTTSPIRDRAGRVIGISKVARDITELKRSQQALARAKEAAEVAGQELEAFSYSVAHDLRAPLRGMNGFAQLLLDEYGDKFDAEGRDWLEEIRLNSTRMAALIDALLSLARVTRTELRREVVDLSTLVGAVAAQLAKAEPERRVELVIANGLRAELDPRLARALVDNLVSNAWKFTAKREQARVELGASSGVFFVRDNGAGFDMAFAHKLFAPFQRLHSATEFAGTGIGLATVQRIVHRHGGRIWAEGVVDGGATFYFSIPRGPTEELR